MHGSRFLLGAGMPGRRSLSGTGWVCTGGGERVVIPEGRWVYEGDGCTRRRGQVY